MDNILDSLSGFIVTADVWIIAISGVLLALAGVAKLTKTDKDDKLVQKAIDMLNKIKGMLPSKKTAKK